MGSRSSTMGSDALKNGFNSIFNIACIFLVVGCENNTTRKQYYEAGENVYIGETMQYDNIDVTVNQLTISKNENPYSDYYGLYLLDISLLLKNNRTKEFNFSYDNVYIKTEDRGEK